MEDRTFIICRASAGSGKTFTLVKQFIRLAFDCSDNDGALRERFKRILAITFTNKAANEMKERVLSYLAAIAEDPRCDMGRAVSDETHTPPEKLQHKAAMVHSAILHSYSDLSVCTIDSFVHRVVRTFAHDLGLPMNFDLMTDSKELIPQTVDELMALVGTENEDDLTRLLCEYGESCMEEGKSFKVENQIAELAEQLYQENTPAYLKQLDRISMKQFMEIFEAQNKERRNFEKRITEPCSQILQTMQDHGVQAADLADGIKGVYSYLNKMRNKEFVHPTATALKFLEGDKSYSSKCDPSKQQYIQDELKPAILEAYHDISRLMEQGLVQYYSRQQLCKNLFALALLNKLKQITEQYSHDNEVLHISEFNREINRIVQEEPAPFIYERLGNRYQNFLIDEFQDTSRLQWQNLVPLVENGVSGGHTSLVVGDGKQAIYRFRQGEVEQFVALPEVDSPLHGQSLKRNAREENLEYNFRSGEAVVEFNNHFFDWIIKNRFPDNALLQSIYVDKAGNSLVKQLPRKKGGMVQLNFCTTKENSRELVWQQVLEAIDRQVNGKGYHFSDITLLARDNKTLATLSEYLQAHPIDGKKIPMVSSESFLLKNSRVVRLMRCTLQYLVDENDRTAMVNMLLLLRELRRIRNTHEELFLDKQTPDMTELLRHEGLEFNASRLRALSLYDCCEELLRVLGLQDIESAYTATFLGVVANYSKTHHENWSEFLDWLDEHIEKISTSTDDHLDAVRLMTIHKAKGLESPIIIYPIINKKPIAKEIWVEVDDPSLGLPVGLVSKKKDCPTVFDGLFEIEDSKSEMDDINLLYVALTRPRQKLIVCSDLPQGEKSYPKLLNDFAVHCEQNQPEGVECTYAELGATEQYLFGEDAEAVHEAREEQRKSVAIDHISFPDWSHRIAIASQSDRVFDPLAKEHIRIGLQMHDVLSHIVSCDDVDKAVEQYQQQQHLDEAGIAQLRRQLHQMVAHPDCARFFAPGIEVKNECSLMFHGEVLRPDRIVFDKEEVWVIDFKTGLPNPKYLDQVEHYCDAIHAMGYSQVHGCLIFIGSTVQMTKVR